MEITHTHTHTHTGIHTKEHRNRIIIFRINAITETETTTTTKQNRICFQSLETAQSTRSKIYDRQLRKQQQHWKKKSIWIRIGYGSNWNSNPNWMCLCVCRSHILNSEATKIGLENWRRLIKYWKKVSDKGVRQRKSQRKRLKFICALFEGTC